MSTTSMLDMTGVNPKALGNPMGTPKSMKTNIGAAIICVILGTGCISHHETVTKDVERRKIDFENDAAARTFYEAVSHLPNNGAKTEKTSKFEIPVVLEYERHVVTGPNATFNQAVDRCDTNRDGRITEVEARIFAEQVEGNGHPRK